MNGSPDAEVDEVENTAVLDLFLLSSLSLSLFRPRPRHRHRIDSFLLVVEEYHAEIHNPHFYHLSFVLHVCVFLLLLLLLSDNRVVVGLDLLLNHLLLLHSFLLPKKSEEPGEEDSFHCCCHDQKTRMKQFLSKWGGRSLSWLDRTWPTLV